MNPESLTRKMNLDRFSLLLIITFLGYHPGLAQQPLHIPGQILVSLQPGILPQTIARRMEETLSVPATKVEKVSNLLNVWLLETDSRDEQIMLEWTRRQPEVRVAQYNFLLENRNNSPYNVIPNDPLFNQQWQYVNTGANGGVPNADLDAELAWDIATGGLTAAGDTIVVVVIDGGIELNHSDLAPNLWVNRAETPDDSIDNDNNGFTDDFHGWNVWYNNDNIAGASTGHGTPVSAIIGAKGNNSNGVTGINWNVKIMFVAGGGSQANILAAYDYVLQSRRRYNATNGQSGAFVVAINCSWGTDYGQPSDAPLWCAAFDTLGQAGILSIAATANNPVNVDDVGDLPTTCTSDYLVAVTSLNNADLKAPNAAWGATHIDLGAYGQGVFTAGANGSYGPYYGTSFAAPQVSGAIGLLYASPCPNLIAMSKTDPAAAALWAKYLLLNSTVPNAALQDITVTGGRLNLYSLLQEYEDQCSPCPPPFALHTTNISNNSALLKWSEIADFETVTLYWRQAGSGNWNIADGVENSFLLENLNACTEYEFALSAICWQGISSGWSAVVSFKTDGCCEPPASLWWEWIGATSTSMAWNNVTAATGYHLRVRPAGGNWEIYTVNTNSFTLQNLLPCTDYEAQVQTLCDTGATVFSTSCFFNTAGCGSCTDADYCPAKAEDASDEWIASVEIGNWLHVSGDGGGGYQNFTGSLFDMPQFLPQVPVDVTIAPGFQNLPYKEFFRIYIDFNMDGDFDDGGELAFDPGWASDDAVSGQVVPPDFLNPGITRMRVMMKYKGPNNQPPVPCETFEFGQVEDYCAELSNGAVSVGLDGSNSNSLLIYPQPAREEVWINVNGETSGPWNISVWDMTGRNFVPDVITLYNGLMRINTSDWIKGMYMIRMEQGDRIFVGKILKQ